MKAKSFTFRAIYLFVLTGGAASGSGPTTAELDDATQFATAGPAGLP